jgi:hypothetical protein
MMPAIAFVVKPQSFIPVKLYWISLVIFKRERGNVDLSGINVIEMPVPSTLGIMSIGHNISDARLLTPLRVGTIVINQGNQSDHENLVIGWSLC